MTIPASPMPARGRERVLSAALQLFAVQGFDRTTTRDIGHAAGITSPALYRHYATKDALGLDLYRRCYATMIAAVRDGTDAIAAPIDRLAAYPAVLSALYERAPLAVLYIDEHQLRFWPQLRDEFVPDTLSGLVSRWIAAGRAGGSVRGDVDPIALVALVMGLPSQWFAMRRAGLAEADNAATSLPLLVRAGLAPAVPR